MNQFEASLVAMQKFLTAVDCGWSSWVAESLRRLRKFGDSRHMLGAYGGMGSFNDVIICAYNGYPINEAQEPWANTFFELLSSMVYHFAHFPEIDVSLDELTSEFEGTHLGVLPQAPPADTGASRWHELSGVACGKCGYREASFSGVAGFIAHLLLPQQILKASAEGSLEKLVDDVLNLNIPGAKEWTAEVSDSLRANGVELSDKDWNERCPICRSPDLEGLTWVLASTTPIEFDSVE